MNSSILAKRLKNLREQHGYLQRFVSDKIGIKSNTLSGYENGTRSPDPEMLVELAKLYNVTTDYLLGRTDNPNTYQDDSNDSLEQINQLLKKYNIDQSGFFDIEKWKSMGPEEIKQLESYFEFIVQEAEKKKASDSD